MFFLLDLDGTLVITESIYFNVWNELLNEYNITLTEEIFKNFIQGNNDLYVKNSLLSEVTIDLQELSNKKDDLFIKNIDKIKVIDGVYVFLNNLKQNGHECCIVTNCNKRVAAYIVEYLQFDVKFIVSSSDSILGKPYPDPYNLAIKMFCTTRDECIIIEDSKSGLLSGKSVKPKLLIGITTIYKEDELIKYGVNRIIHDYVGFDFNIEYDQVNTVVDDLKHIFNADIIVNNNKLKGGNISDVISFKVNDPIKTSEYILKYESSHINMLSNMAIQLQLYDREYYFYTDVSKYINIHIPQFISLLNDKHRGIIIEKMPIHYINNLNLNNDIELSLKIVNEISKMHILFWNKNLNEVLPGLKKNNDITFNPFMKEFLKDKMNLFIEKWGFLIKHNNLNSIYDDFENIQNRLSNKNLTFIHGDLKSPNIFYDTLNNNNPCFIDWQHCCIGKGVQDLIFFIIESFDIEQIKHIFPIFKNYYYYKIIQSNIKYSYEDYNADINDAIRYIPFFTSVWFGTIPNDDLIDKNFPYFFISKFILLLNINES